MVINYFHHQMKIQKDSFGWQYKLKFIKQKQIKVSQTISKTELQRISLLYITDTANTFLHTFRIPRYTIQCPFQPQKSLLVSILAQHQKIVQCHTHRVTGRGKQNRSVLRIGLSFMVNSVTVPLPHHPTIIAFIILQLGHKNLIFINYHYHCVRGFALHTRTHPHQ